MKKIDRVIAVWGVLMHAVLVAWGVYLAWSLSDAPGILVHLLPGAFLASGYGGLASDYKEHLARGTEAMRARHLREREALKRDRCARALADGRSFTVFGECPACGEVVNAPHSLECSTRRRRSQGGHR